MTEYNRKRVLLKALKRAIKNGYRPATIGLYYCEPQTAKYIVETAFENDGFSVFDIVYSHEFATAYWGKEMIVSDCKRQTMCYTQTMPKWAWMLMEMVVYTDPLDYLAIR